MVDLKCAGCGEITTLPVMPKKFLCRFCGAPNTPQPSTVGTGAEACSCILPTSFEWKMPSGVIGEGDNLMYSTPDDPGCYLTRYEWIEVYGYDPKAKLEEMRRRGKEGVPGYFNCSTLGRKR